MYASFLLAGKAFSGGVRSGIIAAMSERFYVNQPLSPGPITLDGEEAHHLAQVSRHAVGDAVILFNGDGCSYPARVLTVRKRDVELEILDCLREVRELPHPVTIACPLPRGDRGQFLVEKLTELGVASLQLITTARTQAYRSEVKLDKLRRYAIEASKQCGRNVIMRVSGAMTWTELLESMADVPHRLVAAPGGEPLARHEVRGPTAIAVGPEGGLTDLEVGAARDAGWTVVSLGARILRVETAAVAGAAWAALWQERL
jgi:16S rRNA (uracil1498-N3)-methyltransferase